MRDHAGSDQHSLASQAAIANQSVSVIQQLLNVAEKERKMNRNAVKSFVLLKKCLSIVVGKRMARQRSTFRYQAPEEGRCREHL